MYSKVCQNAIRNKLTIILTVYIFYIRRFQLTSILWVLTAV